MSKFPEFVRYILEKEGGSKISNNPADPGGLTKWGISIRFAGSIRLDIDRNGKTDSADITGLNQEQAILIYREHFWDKIGLDRFSDAVALVLFDAAVNQGPQAAARDLQLAAGVLSDGQIGPKTLAAVKSIPDAELVTRLIAYRGLRYASTKNFDTFGRGWMRRLMETAILASKNL